MGKHAEMMATTTAATRLVKGAVGCFSIVVLKDLVYYLLLLQFRLAMSSPGNYRWILAHKAYIIIRCLVVIVMCPDVMDSLRST